MGFAECHHLCAEKNAGFGCIDEADVNNVSNILPKDMTWAFIGKYATTPGNNEVWSWADPNCTTTSSPWDEGQPNDHKGRPDDCVVVHDDEDGWHDFPCCGWAQCICNPAIPIAEHLNQNLCVEACRSEHGNDEDMCSNEKCAGCRECGNIGLQTREELICTWTSTAAGTSAIAVVMLSILFLVCTI